MTTCPNCGSAVQTDASFCGQCGFNLQAASNEAAPTVSPDFDIPDLPPPEPLVQPDPLMANVPPPPPPVSPPPPASSPPPPTLQPEASPPPPQPIAANYPNSPPAPVAGQAGAVSAGDNRTQLQMISARLLHVQTNQMIELPQNLQVVHIGKPNDRIPPDIDVSGFPNSEIVSRIHADIRLEGDSFFVEDVGSSNGTYVNNLPLPAGNRHRLRPGDRISLGKGDKVSFLFQLA